LTRPHDQAEIAMPEERRSRISTRAETRPERWLAFLCLARIRLYRAGRMLAVLARGDGRAISGAWNRD
jgi:hypothetical protein